MSIILSQQRLDFGPRVYLATVIKLVAASDTVTLPRMLSTSGNVVQVRRPGEEVLSAVTQSSAIAVSVTGKTGNEYMLISEHDNPIPNPTGDGA